MEEPACEQSIETTGREGRNCCIVMQGYMQAFKAVREILLNSVQYRHTVINEIIWEVWLQEYRYVHDRGVK